AARYGELAKKMAEAATSEAERVAAARCAEVAKAYVAYETLKRDAVAVDFGDLVALPVDLLERFPAIRDELADRYSHILVDEYQDVNRSSVRLLQLLTDKGRNLWAVGDARQSIYRFRGASAINMDRFDTADFPGAKRGRLEVNYRSTQEIVEAYSTFGAGMIAGGGDARLCAHRGPSEHPPEHRIVLSTDDEAAGLAETISSMRAAHFDFRDQAILCSGNERLARLGRELEQRGVPVLFLGSLFERPEIKDLLAWLTLLVDRRAMGLGRRRAPEDLNPSLGDVAAILADLRASNPAPLAWLAADRSIPGLSAAGQAVLARIAPVLEGFGPTSRPWDVLARLLLDRTRLAADIAGAADVAGRARGLAIWQFMNFVRVQPPAQGAPIQVLLERIRRLIQLADERDLRQLPLAASGINAVRLMTIHGSKGLEFPVVHVMGLNANALPRTAADPACPPPDGLIEGPERQGLAAIRAGRIEEQECVFYVALSRARDRLFIYSAAQTANGGSRSPSPYLTRLGPGLVERRLGAAPAGMPDPDLAPIPIRFQGRLSYTEAQLAQYDRCPRRFFYTYVLQVGGRRSTTPFMDMHEVVGGVVATLATRPPGELTTAEVAETFEAAWAAHRVSGHGYADDFQAIARSLVSYYVDSRTGQRLEPPGPLRLAVPGGEVVVTPDEILVAPDGARAVRRVRTGHKRSKEETGIAAAAFQLAANEAFPGCRVELVFLGDGEPTPVNLTAKTLINRRATVAEMLAGISAGRFQAEESSFTCPRCPAFFICGPVPAGRLDKKF
ncbi:MAG: putative ATP-dependent helicase, partial [Caulobacteraceae bacterium]|nr:putative ATP-dependent helicase [Caulobacteraceae bacterium]